MAGFVSAVDTGKNALFAGNEVRAENWAMLASLVVTCKISGMNAVDYLAETLRAILDGHPKSRIEGLMPWCYAQTSSLAAYAAASRLLMIRLDAGTSAARIANSCGQWDCV